MNLASNTERWLSLSAADLIKAGKKHKNFNLAERTVDAVTPCLTKLSEGYVSEAGDIEVFLYMAIDTESKKVLASIVKQSAPKDTQPSTEDEKTEQSKTDLVPRVTVYDEEAKDLVASFVCDFPDALFSVEGGMPVVMFIDVGVPKGTAASAKGVVPGEKLKRYVTLNNMLEAVENKWYKMCIAVPGGNAKSKKEGCNAQAFSRAK
jgi:hypothetical protein